jgi:hypothetical protein
MPRGVRNKEEAVSGVEESERDNGAVGSMEAAVVDSKRITVVEDPLQPRGNSRLQRLTRKRPGWHQVWKHPDEIDDAKDVGYRIVRETVEGDKLGYESGPSITVSRDDKVELYLMEIEEWKFDQHLVALSQGSQARYGALKAQFRRTVDEVNIQAGGRGKEIFVNDSNSE